MKWILLIWAIALIVCLVDAYFSPIQKDDEEW